MTEFTGERHDKAVTPVVMHGVKSDGSADGVNIDEQGGLHVGAGPGKPVEHRIVVCTNPNTPDNRNDVLTSDLSTFTFNESDNRRNIRVALLGDPNANVMAAAFTINAGDDVTAAARLTQTEGDIDERAFRIGRDMAIELRSSVAITRVDVVPVKASGTATYGNDLVQVEVW